MALRADGNKTLADVLKKGIIPRMLSDEKALAILIDAKLTKRGYSIIREPAMDVFPPYSRITEAKVKCYPPEDQFEFSEVFAKVKLQSILNHTISRLLDSCKFDFDP